MSKTVDVRLDHFTEIHDLVGLYVPAGRKICWQDGPLAQAIKSGNHVHLRGLRQARGEVLEPLMSALLDPASVSASVTGARLGVASGFCWSADAYSNGFMVNPKYALLPAGFCVREIDVEFVQRRGAWAGCITTYVPRDWDPPRRWLLDGGPTWWDAPATGPREFPSEAPGE